MDKSLGQLAFEAYSASMGGKTFDGRAITLWGALGDAVRGGWAAAATAVWVESVKPVPANVEQQPSIGRMVHFVDVDGQHRPAIIVQVFPDANGAVESCGLVVFEPAFAPARYTCPIMQDASFAVGTWHWPEYVPAQ